MSEAKFLDTNVLLYLLSVDSGKANRAEALLADGAMISVQVLNELASVTSRKQSLTWPEINDFLSGLCSICHVHPLTLETHDLGLRLIQRYQFALYDAMIVASALLATCTVLYSEDFQDGMRVDQTLTIRNPFF